MMRYKTASTVTTTSEPGAAPKSGSICRLRLTLPADANVRSEQKETKNENQIHVDIKNTAERRKKRNGYTSERTPSEPPTLHLYTVPRNTPSSGTPSHGVVYGVVQRSENNQQNEVVVYEWSSHQLKEEMNYIKDVRVTLEKIREKMFGEYDDMKEKMKRLTQEMKVSTAKQELLEHHSQTQASAIDRFDSINSSLNASSLDMQKQVVDMTLENCSIRDEVKSLKHSYDVSLDKLKEKQKLLDAAQAENQQLKIKIESSHEANANVLREMTRKVYSQYEQKLQEEELKYNADKEVLIAQAKQYIKAVEDASEKVQVAESKIEERDAKIAELDSLVHRMQQEREHLQVQLTSHEERIQRLDAKMEITASERARTQNLEEAATSLRERIKHLDDMVHCQQKKVKHMIEEIELLRKKVHYKDLLIQQLLERIALLEGENNELQDKMEYLMANQPKETPETKDAETSCDLQPRNFIARLPDRGKKILDYTEKVRAAIEEHKRTQKTLDLLSKIKLEFEEKQNEIKGKAQISWPMDKKTLALPAETLQNTSSNSPANVSERKNKPNTGTFATPSEAECKTNENTENSSLPVENLSKTENPSYKDTSSPSLSKYSLHEEDRSDADTTVSPFTADALSEMSRKTIVDAGSLPVHEDRNQKTAKNDAGATDDLADSLKMISINGSAERGSDDSSNQPKNPSNPYTTQSHFLDVIEKRAKSPVYRKEKFQTNRLPSGSNSSTPNQSPGEKALRLSAEERRAQDRKHLDDITAARLPPLHYLPALLLPLDESLTLQIDQNKSYEEKQAKFAAQRLFEKLNIKMEPYNPEGESYMKYRDQRDEEDGID
ncbi:GRINL1A combined protein isoform X3 [Rana temporaria]|uniref:GRINL1A combined protein isoform X3 n=1 Tax=Rana temporaria TaxID=8407 RepID=UPI001AAD595D|nr:GRINL1A combined protein isoform X3 [Rana temporaria]